MVYKRSDSSVETPNEDSTQRGGFRRTARPDDARLGSKRELDGGLQADESVGSNDAAGSAAESQGEHDQGYDRGYTEGHQAGYDAGWQKGQAEGEAAGRADAEAHAAELSALMNALAQPLNSLDRPLADELARGAISLAQTIVSIAVHSDPQALADMVDGIIADAREAGSDENGPVQIHMAPSFAQAAAGVLDNPEIAIVEDSNLAPGDVWAQYGDSTTPNNLIEWDARLRTRWNQIREAMSLPVQSTDNESD